ncbi:hypothetical protein Tco_0789886 [Tanacetum coccineum]
MTSMASSFLILGFKLACTSFLDLPWSCLELHLSEGLRTSYERCGGVEGCGLPRDDEVVRLECKGDKEVHSKAYRFYVIEPNDSVSINSIMESRDAIFDENRFSSIPRPKDIIPNSVESQRDGHSDDVPSEMLKPCKEAIDDEIGSIMENDI